MLIVIHKYFLNLVIYYSRSDYLLNISTKTAGTLRLNCGIKRAPSRARNIRKSLCLFFISAHALSRSKK